jgi:hypothetical protein
VVEVPWLAAAGAADVAGGAAPRTIWMVWSVSTPSKGEKRHKYKNKFEKLKGFHASTIQA